MIEPRVSRVSRRALLAGGAGAALTTLLPTVGWTAQTPVPSLRTIPSSGAGIPAIGLGSWITFNVGDSPVLRARCTEVMDAFFQAGGRMIDSSPMYGSAQSVIGDGLRSLGRADTVFATDKVWISDTDDGPDQIAESRALWQVPKFDLLQVHNLVGWEGHLRTLFEMKQSGRLSYVGITTSHGRRHRDLAEIMAREPIDFVQLTYNVRDRAAADRLLPLAQDRGIAVIVNRPFRRGGLTRPLESQALPDWAGEVGASTWAQLLLKFILAHPAVTSAIPATTQPHHAIENLMASTGPMLDADLSRRLIAQVETLI
ncbi:MAG: aldo/keto reductase [Alphaproteobacteria bacterium]|nr:aldo/keto reductase [Alphaproteobacteria bacterium]